MNNNQDITGKPLDIVSQKTADIMKQLEASIAPMPQEQAIQKQFSADETRLLELSKQRSVIENKIDDYKKQHDLEFSKFDQLVDSLPPVNLQDHPILEGLALKREEIAIQIRTETNKQELIAIEKKRNEEEAIKRNSVGEFLLIEEEGQYEVLNRIFKEENIEVVWNGASERVMRGFYTETKNEPKLKSLFPNGEIYYRKDFRYAKNLDELKLELLDERIADVTFDINYSKGELGLDFTDPIQLCIDEYRDKIKHLKGTEELFKKADKLMRLHSARTKESKRQELNRIRPATTTSICDQQTNNKIQNIGQSLKSIDFLGIINNKYQYYKAHGKPELTGLKTNFPKLDYMLNGLQPGHLIVIGARPSMGKTWKSLNIAKQIAEQGKKVLMFALEMSELALTYRLLSLMTGINARRIECGEFYTKEEYDKVIEAYKTLSDLGIFITENTANEDIDILVQTLTEAHKEHNFDLIIIDHLQLMDSKTGGENRNLAMGDVSRKIKVLAKELKIPIVALSQLSRGVDSRVDKRPILADLRDSGAIEQDADVVIFLYREYVYNPEATPNMIEVIVAKNRSGGKTGTIDFTYDQTTWQFYEIDENQEDKKVDDNNATQTSTGNKNETPPQVASRPNFTDIANPNRSNIATRKQIDGRN